METKQLVQTVLVCCIVHLMFSLLRWEHVAVGQTTTMPDTPETIDEQLTPVEKRPRNRRNKNKNKVLDPDQRTDAQLKRERKAIEAHVVHSRPPLDEIITANNTIIGDPEWLVNFGILGFGKCGTSTMMVWLREHPEIQAFDQELNDLMQRRPGRMVRRFYQHLEAGPFIRGYKAPQDVSQPHILDYYRQYWPKAKLIIGIRHPISWFQSLYNFRVQNHHGDQFPHPNKLIGACTRGKYNTCTDKGNFGFQLLKLGLQNYPSSRAPNSIEQNILGRYPRLKMNVSGYRPVTNPIFIFELEQMGDQNETRNELFRHDVTEFMALNELLPQLPHRIPGKKRSEEEQKRRNAMKIDICDDVYKPLRKDLLELSTQSSLWIRKVFLAHPNVKVSSPEFFVDIMQRWEIDPCMSRTELSQTK